MRSWWLAVAFPLLVASTGAMALDDPMRPPGRQQARPVASQPQLLLTSVMIHSDRRVAVINGERVREGSQIAGARVVSITPSTVTLSRGGKLSVLSLLNLQVKTVSTREEE